MNIVIITPSLTRARSRLRRSETTESTGHWSVVSSLAPPALLAVREPASRIRVEVNGLAGQRVVRQRTIDFQTWQPLATNWLTTNRWSYFDRTTDDTRRFYRARLQ